MSVEERDLGSQDLTVLGQICSGLRVRQEQLEEQIHDLHREGCCCQDVLRRLSLEESEWADKLQEVRKKMSHAEHQKLEADLLLELHERLDNVTGLGDIVKSIQHILSAEVPEDVKVMVGDCLNHKSGVTTGSCVSCYLEFTAEDLLSVKNSERCRHAISPCGHAVVCGTCAKKIWETSKKCPLCRAPMKRIPKIFKPGRWQMS